jgi:hypothetical protein
LFVCGCYTWGLVNSSLWSTAYHTGQVGFQNQLRPPPPSRRTASLQPYCPPSNVTTMLQQNGVVSSKEQHGMASKHVSVGMIVHARYTHRDLAATPNCCCCTTSTRLHYTQAKRKPLLPLRLATLIYKNKKPLLPLTTCSNATSWLRCRHKQGAPPQPQVAAPDT